MSRTAKLYTDINKKSRKPRKGDKYCEFCIKDNRNLWHCKNQDNDSWTPDACTIQEGGRSNCAHARKMKVKQDGEYPFKPRIG